MDQELHQRVVIQVARADVVADLYAKMAGGARARRFLAGQIQVLQRHLRQRFQARWRVGAMLKRQVVHARRPIGRGLAWVGVAEHDRRGAQELYVHAVAVQLGDAQRRVPQGRVYWPERPVAGHDLAGDAIAVSPQPRRVDGVQRGRFLPGDRRKEVGGD
ncbi:hypothetical protein G6F35_016773 [Rhizopus arrhizus]|nr:hypothetical protein G6F35_016773 [Rhizopus arrhizus]